MIKISRRGSIVVGLAGLLLAIGITLVFAQRAQPRLWTAAGVFKHLESYGQLSKNVNTNYSALPQNLAFNPPSACREHVVFSIVIGGEEIPYNQLFICDRIEDIGAIKTYYLNRLKNSYSIVSSDTAMVTLVLNPDITEGVARLYAQSLAMLGMRYVGPLD